MSPLFAAPPSSLVWLEAHRLLAGTARTTLSGMPDEAQFLDALGSLPQGPSRWVVDDLWVPSLLLRDLAELPKGAEAQEAFLRWRFTQALALEEPHFVQAMAVEPGVWLACGVREELRDLFLRVGAAAERHVHALIPRWLHLYNLVAPEQQMPGMMLSLSPAGQGRFAGTLVAWGRTLCLVRQWSEPLDPAGWMEDRIAPSAAFLQRESRPPQQLLVYGAPHWPAGSLPLRQLDDRFAFDGSL